MSESKTEDETLSFKRYDPKYPLPQEILQMSRDETVCQFCGVSYLIHTEIKKLEARIKVQFERSFFVSVLHLALF